MGTTDEVEVSNSRHNFGNYLPLMREKDRVAIPNCAHESRMRE